VHLSREVAAEPSVSAGRLPDFLIVGAPKAGTTALHTALAEHPGLALSTPKEPKYFLCGDAPAPLYRGPGDAHSRREWIWRRDEYLRLFASADDDQLCGESTPLYLHSADAVRRIAAELPRVRLVVILRDPVDRAYSNWMHLWVDGMEPVSDFITACELENKRIDAGWAPFWRYRQLGKYGEQLRRLYDHFDRQQVLVLRYRDLVDNPGPTLDRVCRFLAVETGLVTTVPPDNTRPYLSDNPSTRAFAKAMRAGARLGAHLPPQVWRNASRPLLASMHRRSDEARPHLPSEQRRHLLEHFRDDIALLGTVTGTPYDDWLDDSGPGGFATRVAQGALSR
jgi:Sulfotransferase family